MGVSTFRGDQSTRSPRGRAVPFFHSFFFFRSEASKGRRGLEEVQMSSAAGTGVDDACVLKFKDLKHKRKHKFVIFKIDSSSIVVASEGAPTASFDEFVEALPENEPRYAVFDFDYDKDGCKKSKIMFVTWNPDTAPIRQKMIYASSKDRFKRELDGIQVELQATDFSEVEEKAFIDKVSGF